MTGTPLDAVAEDVYAEFGALVLQAHFSAQIALALGIPGPDELIRAGRGGVTFRSGGVDHVARMRVEAWSSRPARPSGAWEEQAEGVLVVDSAELRLASGTAWASSTSLRLPAPDAYSVLVVVSGRSNVPSYPPEPPRGVKRWHVQLWPA
ncbi:hypothetical protein [Saccharothrix syringae]|uniref:Uncharacterized protein n=1 Tax=Saccharothrix syringae TaxID=103733 RepID=A0A5Q0H3R2_SACSY|nr:hypothetical protein [Saccharothrix syringae]QFZ20450.1 hypothetical protein EKG83_26255 [Saccharothrix syringae]